MEDLKHSLLILFLKIWSHNCHPRRHRSQVKIILLLDKTHNKRHMELFIYLEHFSFPLSILMIQKNWWLRKYSSKNWGIPVNKRFEASLLCFEALLSVICYYNQPNLRWNSSFECYISKKSRNSKFWSFVLPNEV